MEKSFEIISYVGAKPLLFGMTEHQVAAIAGPPSEKFMNADSGESRADHDMFSIRYSRLDKGMVEIGFSKYSRVIIRGMDLFNDAGAFQELLRQDSCPYESHGFIVLFNLGITLPGFHDNDPDQLAITAFVRGRWDDVKSDLRKLPVPK